MNVIVWADIPVIDLDRASKFYSQVIGMPVRRMPGAVDVAVPGPAEGQQPAEGSDNMTVAFDLYVGGKPSVDGPTIYLSAMGDINAAVQRVRDAGGEILQEPQDMGQMIGTLAYFKDTEGNRIGLHHPPAGM